MFDFGFSEMLLVGVVALVVLGPERLPVVARTAGEWIGKAQRFVAQVKSDIDREAELSELKKIQEEARALANDVKSTVEKVGAGIEKDANAAASELEKAGNSAKEAYDSVSDSIAETAKDVADSDVATTVNRASDDDIASVYGWGNTSSDTVATASDYSAWREPKTFEKRYHCGPSVDELAAEVEKLRRELGMREVAMGSSNRRLAPRARSNRPRIYR